MQYGIVFSKRTGQELADLAAAAARPLLRRKPWDLASTTSTPDRLSNGCVTLGVGMGALHPRWLAFGCRID